LNLTTEEPIDPDLPICDPHHHLWDGPGDRGRYLLDEYLQDAGSGHKIVKTVFVECGAMYRKDGPQEMRPVGETEFVQGIATQSASGQYGRPTVAAGIVGFADLTLGANVVPVLEAHLAASKNHFQGIRQSCTWDSDRAILSMGKGKGMMMDTKFREGFACLQQYGLSFDAWQYYTQLMELADLAREFPDTTIIVNHTGGLLGVGRYAGKRQEVIHEWRRRMTELASCPNVVVKLGGLGMPRCGFGWHEQTKPPSSTELAEAMAPCYRFCIEVFGAGRCMFESDFPVDKVSYSYTVLWNAFKRICEDSSPKERAALFHDTAVKVYRLDDSNRA
jgi:predicted TIM-barrel fold metal-dependent hydrolase